MNKAVNKSQACAIDLIFCEVTNIFDIYDQLIRSLQNLRILRCHTKIKFSFSIDVEIKTSSLCKFYDTLPCDY